MTTAHDAPNLTVATVEARWRTHGEDYPISGDATALARAATALGRYPAMGGPLHGRMVITPTPRFAIEGFATPSRPLWEEIINPLETVPTVRYTFRLLADGRAVYVLDGYRGTPDARTDQP